MGVFLCFIISWNPGCDTVTNSFSCAFILLTGDLGSTFTPPVVSLFFLFFSFFYPQAQILFKVTLREVRNTLPGTLPVFFFPLCTVYKNCIREPVCVTSLQRDWLLLYLSVTVCKYSEYKCVWLAESLSSLSHFYTDAAHALIHTHWNIHAVQTYTHSVQFLTEKSLLLSSLHPHIEL